ncbi:MAG: prefoldin alpha subunit [Natronomonas sp.]|jgi:prefoldin alpha subunit|uniref:prefoldin subunit alpha n=1 Tax=Natronomonas sp. TaxID=2184060 RepID=UPI0039896736
MSLGGGGGGGAMQQIQEQMQALEQEKEAIQNEIENVRTEQGEIDEAIEAIGALDSGATVQVPLGGDAYVRAEIQDMDEVIVTLGGGYAAERDSDGAVDSLERKKETLDDRIADLEEEIEAVEAETEDLEAKAQQAQQQQMQQMQQQMQQDDE